MAWDDNKSTAADPENPTADEQLSADEWDAHVADQKGHASRHEKGGSDELNTFGDTVHDSVDTFAQTFGGTGTTPSNTVKRPLISTEDQTISVPTDMSLQDALYSCPLYLRHNYTIDLEAGTYAGTYHAPPVIAGDVNLTTETGDWAITGDVASPSNVKVGALMFRGFVGGQDHPSINGIEFTELDDVSDEQSSVSFIGCWGSARIDRCNFTDSTGGVGIVNYHSSLKCGGSLDFTGGTYSQGIRNKGTSLAIVTGEFGDITGNFSSAVLAANGGTIYYDPLALPDVGTTRNVKVSSFGQAYDWRNGGVVTSSSLGSLSSGSGSGSGSFDGGTNTLTLETTSYRFSSGPITVDTIVASENARGQRIMLHAPSDGNTATLTENDNMNLGGSSIGLTGFNDIVELIDLNGSGNYYLVDRWN